MVESNNDALDLGSVLELLDARIHPVAVYLFGSAARDELRADSDIDLAFLADITLPPYEQYLISQEAAELLHREVDLINLRTVETVFCAQVITRCRVLVNRDRQRVASFHIRTLKEYALLNEERALILKSIRDRGRLLPDDVILNKLAVIKRCVKRMEEEYNGQPSNLENFTKQDSIVLNLQRACEACIDVAMYIVSERALGLPQSSRDAFQLLQHNDLISDDLAARMKAMVGFRNIAVHNYQSLDTSILQSIIDRHLPDFQTFSDAIQKLT